MLCWFRSESAAPEEQNENHGWTGQGDQGQGGEVGDQMKVETHGCRRDGAKSLRTSLRGRLWALSASLASVTACHSLPTCKAEG